MVRTVLITTFRDRTAKLWDEQYFGETKNERFFKGRVFFKDPKYVNLRSARPPVSYTYWVRSNKRACPWKQFDTLVEAIDQLPTSL